MAMAIIYFLEPLPESSVLVGGSQGLAPLLHVRSGTVYLILIESRWAPNDSSLLRQSERLIPAARQSWAEDLWMCKGEHKWFLIGRQAMTGALYYSSWISVVVWISAKDGRSKLDFGKGKSDDESELAPSRGLCRQYGTLSSASLHQFFLKWEPHCTTLRGARALLEKNKPLGIILRWPLALASSWWKRAPKPSG